MSERRPKGRGSPGRSERRPGLPPRRVVMQTVRSVAGVVVGDEFLVGGDSRPSDFRWRTWKHRELKPHAGKQLGQ